ncbi:MAG: hypothetical protein IT443_04020 [Phycisphaeraceae bacterium]|nr:hypothetical protein [Phycisphaeraceae bacterium]
MVTEKDLKYLRKSTSKVGKWAVMIVFPVASCLMFAAGIGNIRLCSRFAKMADMTLGEVIQASFQDINVYERYTGFFLRAVDRLQAGVLAIAGGIFIAICFWVCLHTAKRNARILKFIESRLAEPGVEKSSDAKV